MSKLKSRKRCCRAGLYLGLFCLAASPFLHAQSSHDWNQWRGPERNGHAAPTPIWPDQLHGEHLVEQWRVPLSSSYSGPLVVGDRVFTTETREATHEVVYALNRQTGEELWQASWPGAMQVPFFANSNGSWIRATPACDGERLFVAGMRDVLVCLDIEDGAEIWRVDFVERYGTPLPAFGFASSPLVVDEHVYVQAGQSLVKLDAQTGASVWRTAIDSGSTMDSPFSSPMFSEIAGQDIILLQTRTALKGIEPLTGEELWSQEIQAFRGMNILTPTVYRDSVFTSAHSGRSQLWNLIPANDGAQAVAEQWSHKTQAYMSSPVVIGDHLYLHLRNQRLSCLDLRTGEEAWRTTPFGKYWSMVAQEDKILALDERGKLYLIRANPAKFELLDECEVGGDSTWAHLAVSSGQIFVRALDALVAYRWE